MGLDSYFETGDENQIKYWRNHLKLHAWMNDLVKQKGYVIESDYGRNRPGKLIPGRFQLLLEDLESLHTHIDAQPSELWMRNIDRRYDRVDDLDVVAHAIGLLKQGKTIWYYSCW